jgi:translocator protein
MPPIFGFQEASAVAALGAFVFVQISERMYSKRRRKVEYEDIKPKWAPPALVYPIVWNILFVALTLGAFYFLQNTVPDTWQYIAGFTCFTIFIIGTKLWSVLFWDLKSFSGAFGILIGIMAPTIILYLVSSIVGQTGLYYVNVIMVGITILWLWYAAVLNAYWLRFEKKRKYDRI